MSLIRRGDRGPAVKELQALLTSHGYDGGNRGIFGPKTEEAVIAFQKANGLKDDGIVGPKTMGVLKGEPAGPTRITEEDIEAAAKKLAVPTAILKAFIDVESSGRGFFSDGHPAILYERHYLYRLLKSNGYELLAKIAKEARPDLCNNLTGGYRGGLHEVTRLNKAMELHPEYALMSCSWGLFQIMGEHAKRLGYKDVFDFVEQMKSGEPAQLDAVVRFILADKTLHVALKKKDWHTVARIYNGRNYAEKGYHLKLEEAFLRHS